MCVICYGCGGVQARTLTLQQEYNNDLRDVYVDLYFPPKSSEDSDPSSAPSSNSPAAVSSFPSLPSSKTYLITQETLIDYFKQLNKTQPDSVIYQMELRKLDQ